MPCASFPTQSQLLKLRLELGCLSGTASVVASSVEFIVVLLSSAAANPCTSAASTSPSSSTFTSFPTAPALCPCAQLADIISSPIAPTQLCHVLSPCYRYAAQMPSNFLDGIFSYAGFARANANDATAQSPSRDPPKPSAQGTAPPSASAPPILDLSSPSQPLTSSMRQDQRPSTHREPRPQPRRSADEKRLLPDFSIPADAVATPDPRSYMLGGSVNGIMHKKYTPGTSWRPINTINDVNPGVSHSKPKTYGKQYRPPYEAPIGKARHAGQTAYLRMQARSPTIPARSQPSRIERVGASDGASPGKRRKLERDVIELSDHESMGDEREVLSPSASYTSAGTSREVRPSAAHSHPKFTNESTGAIAVSKRPSQPESAFQSVESIANVHRKKARKPGSDRNQGTRHMSPFGGGDLSTSASAAPHMRAAPMEILDDDHADQAKDPRQHILQNFKQGAQDGLKHSNHGHVRSSLTHDNTKSPHFPNMRIDESTSEQPAPDRQATLNSTELRKKFRQAPRKSTDYDGSEDELAISDTKTSRKLVQSPSKAVQAANSAVRRRMQSKPLPKENRRDLPLLFARSHKHELRSLEMEDSEHDLLLRIDSKGWRVMEPDQIHSPSQSKIAINLNDFIKVQTDDVRRIRLEGSRKQDGNCIIVDLEFVNTSDLSEFRDEHARRIPPNGRILSRNEDVMQKVFSKALVLNDKVGASELVQDSIFDADSRNEAVEKATRTRTPLLDYLNSNRAGSKPLMARKRDLSTESVSSKALTRPKRSTRLSVLSYEEETVAHEKAVEKYSIVVGLGPPWAKPLEYARGRQRAVVHFDDLPRLDEEECLNDSLIDFYMIYLCDKLNVPSDKVYFFNTYFFTQLTRDTGRQSMNYKAVEKWTSKFDIFSYDYIVVPINEATHWYLAIICNVSNIARKPMLEDFDNDIAEALERSRKDISIHRVTEENKTYDLPQLQPQNDLGSTIASPDERNDDDTTLFEVDSKLNLVDPDDMGSEAQIQAASSQTLSIPHPRSDQTTEVPQDVMDVDTLPEGILSKLITSPTRKRNKRKHTFPKKDPTQPIILILDSLSQTRSGTVRALKDWLAAEGEAKRGMEVIIKEKGYYPKASQIPMQDNWTDCGVYLLGYVEKFFEDPDQFKNRLLTGEMSSTEDWPEFNPVEMRDNMRKIIFKLAIEQKNAKKAEKKLKSGQDMLKSNLTASKDEPTIPGSKASQSDQVSPVENHGTKASLEAQVTQTERPDPEAISTKALDPRPASPFSPKVGPAHLSTRVSDVKALKESSDSQLKRPESTTPGTNRIKRRKSPEVRIAVTPPTARSARYGEPSSTNVLDKDEHISQTQGAVASMSPSKRRKANEDKDVLKLPPFKTSSVRHHREQSGSARVLQFSPAIQRSEEGNASQPITIGDSQEDQSPDTHVPQPLTMSSPVRKTLRSSASVEEVSDPAPQTTNRAHGQHKDPFPGHELEVKLKEADEERDEPRKRRAGSLPSTPINLERRNEPYFRMNPNVYDRIKARMPGISQDLEIPESPEAESRSAI